LFIRGIGGFGGERGPAGDANTPPNRAPDAVAAEKTITNQALIYRWASGDLNPLHADPEMAALGGTQISVITVDILSQNC
jgi:3-hydroxyacyl-CoA dehydrogenase/3a,7a,12a-trihydroxy-5b-cholest-24-enoyl-CoA hydratase